MTAWSSLIESSGILQRLSELGPAIDEALARDDNSVEEVECIERIRTVLTFIGKRLDGADSNLLVLGHLQTLTGVIAGATERVRSFAQSGDPDHLTHANSSMDTALNTFGVFALPDTPGDLSALREAATSYRKSMAHELELWAAAVANARKQVDELNEKATALEGRITTEAQQLQAAIDAIRDEATGAQKAIGDTYEALAKVLEEKSDSELASQKARFDEAHGARAKEHDEAMEAQQTVFNGALEKAVGVLKATDATWDQKLSDANKAHEEAYATLKKDFEVKAAGLVAVIDGHLARASELVGIIGERGVTSGHKQAADQARSQVVLWQWLTVVAMVLLVVFAGATALDYFAPATFTWLSFARRVYFSIAVGILAAYGASQANRYQQVERRNRKLELELKALDPFLQEVNPEQREQFRLKMAEAFFGRDDGPHGDAGPTNIAEVLKSKENLEALADGLKIVVDRFKR